MKRKKILMGIALLGCTLLPIGANAQEVCGTVKMNSSLAAGTPITLRVNNNYYGVTVDWGDGKPVTYDDRTSVIREIKGVAPGPDATIVVSGYKGWNMLDCTGCGLTNLDITDAKNLESLYANDNHLTTIDLKGQTNLTDLHLGNNDLTELLLTNSDRPETDLPSVETLDLSDNNLGGTFVLRAKNLQYVNIANNQYNIIYTTANTLLKTLICNDNQVKTLSLTSNKEITTLVAHNNDLTTFTLPKSLSEVQQLLCGRLPLKQLDLTTATSLYDLDCSGCGLTTLQMPPKTQLNTLNVSNNKLTLGVLPLKTYMPNKVIFEPQADIDISGAEGLTKKDGVPCAPVTTWEKRTTEVIDLSPYRTIGAAEEYPKTDATFEWFTIDTDGTITPLKEGKAQSAPNDFYTKNGKFAFFTARKKAYAKITSGTYNVSINTLPIVIGDDITSINSTENFKSLQMRNADGGILILGENVPVTVYTLDGKAVWKGTATSNGVYIALQKGIYVINGKKVIK